MKSLPYILFVFFITPFVEKLGTASRAIVCGLWIRYYEPRFRVFPSNKLGSRLQVTLFPKFIYLIFRFFAYLAHFWKVTGIWNILCH